MKRMNHGLLIGLLVCSMGTVALAQGRGFGGGRGPGPRGPGRGGHGPDEAFVVDRDDFHFLLEHHDDVRREVKQLPNGVETITESDNAEVAARIQKHVAAMYQRVEHRRPIRMRDPLFAEIFRNTDKIKMDVEKTGKGVRVTETSDDDYVAKLIQAHAKAVSGFATYGFAEAHKTHAIPGRPKTTSESLHSPAEIADMVFVEFDRIYIPALALTNQGKEVVATKALQRLSSAWNARFVGHFHDMFHDDAQWPRDVSGIAQAIALAAARLESGKSLPAHEELEPIRDILLDARARNDVDYPLDSLSRFHTTMEAIVKPAMKLEAASLAEEQIQQFSELAKQADQAWQEVEQTKFDLVSFGKNQQQRESFPAMLRAEREAISRLTAALDQQDEQAILKAARGLKPPFAKVYMSFGDFGEFAAGR